MRGINTATLETVRLDVSSNHRYEYEATNPKQPPSANASFLLRAINAVKNARTPQGRVTSGVPCAGNFALIKATTSATMMTNTILGVLTAVNLSSVLIEEKMGSILSIPRARRTRQAVQSDELSIVSSTAGREFVTGAAR